MKKPVIRQRNAQMSPFWENGFGSFFNDFWLSDTPNSYLSKEDQDFLPAMDISELKTKFKLKVDLPGFDPKNINVGVEDDSIVLSGKQESENEQEEENFIRKERTSGSFYRKISFPSSADLDKVSCKSKHGTLVVSIPKKTEKQKKNVEIEIE